MGRTCPQLVTEVSTPKTIKKVEKSPRRGRFLSLRHEKVGNQFCWLREKKSNFLPVEGVMSCVCCILVAHSLCSRLRFSLVAFQQQTLESPLLAVEASFLSGSMDYLDVCSLPLMIRSYSLGFPQSLSPHYTSSPLPGKPPAIARTGQRWWFPLCYPAILFGKDQNVMIHSRQNGHHPSHISKKCHF